MNLGNLIFFAVSKSNRLLSATPEVESGPAQKSS
jgi:hypothetical protein